VFLVSEHSTAAAAAFNGELAIHSEKCRQLTGVSDIPALTTDEQLSHNLASYNTTTHFTEHRAAAVTKMRRR